MYRSFLWSVEYKKVSAHSENKIYAGFRERCMRAERMTVELPTRYARMPSHVGIIPDGNRRWADQRGLPRGEGYRPGVDAALRVFSELERLGISEISVYGFTQENVHRPPEQRKAFQGACVEAVARLSELNAELRTVGDSGTPLE